MEVTSPFFGIEWIFQEVGIVLVRRHVEKRVVIGSDSDRAHDFRSNGWSSSLPAALATSS